MKTVKQAHTSARDTQIQNRVDEVEGGVRT